MSYLVHGRAQLLLPQEPERKDETYFLIDKGQGEACAQPTSPVSDLLEQVFETTPVIPDIIGEEALRGGNGSLGGGREPHAQTETTHPQPKPPRRVYLFPKRRSSKKCQIQESCELYSRRLCFGQAHCRDYGSSNHANQALD